MKLFPEIGLDPRKFFSLQRNYFRSVQNRRLFFETLAASRNLDPLLPQTWYKMRMKQALKGQGVSSLLRHYDGNVTTALVQLFPEISFDLSLFRTSVPQRNHLSTRESQVRELLLAFAKSRKFDPLVPDNWYGVTAETVAAFSGNPTLLTWYGGFVGSLMNIFPDIGLDESKFVTKRRNYWANEKNRRNFFLEIAAAHKFDPLTPHYWYNIKMGTLLGGKGSGSVLHFYQGDFKLALLHLFPDIGLDKTKFKFQV